MTSSPEETGSPTASAARDGERPAARHRARILYQSVPPTAVEALAAGRTASAGRFVALARATPVTAVVVARPRLDVP